MNRDKPAVDPARMRFLAENAAAELQQENRETLSPEATGHLLHELRVHQIELEMQNEELRRIQLELEVARSRYFDLYDLAPVSYCCVSERGLFLEANLATADLLGVPRSKLAGQMISRFILKEDQDRYYLHRKKLLDTGEPQAFELRFKKEDGTLFWVSIYAALATHSDGTFMFRIVMSDISERKYQEGMRELNEHLARLVNTNEDFRNSLVDVSASLKNWSGCEAVGIRLRDGDDFPYYETTGFPSEFVHEESKLCQTDNDGEIVRDLSGNPVLECMCGNILSGRFDPAKPFFTTGGSFWTNSTSELLAGFTEADRQSRTRNRCNAMGYESVALVPLRCGEKVLGLLQFNDHIQGRFTPNLIAHFEALADSLSIALSRRQAEEDYRLLFNKMLNGFALHEIICDQHGKPVNYRFLAVNPSFELLTGLQGKDIVGRTVLEVLPDLEHSWIDLYGQVALTGDPAFFEGYTAALNKHYEVTAFRPAPNQFACILSDISQRKRAEIEKVLLEDQLTHAQKMESVGRLAGGVAHDFNNMLSVILGHTEMAMDRIDPTQPLYANLQEIMKAGKRSSHLTHQLMAFARKQTIAPVILDLNETIGNMLEMLKHLIGENIHLTWLPGSNLRPVRMDPSQIDQILANLCVNARDAISSVGNITIETGSVLIEDVSGESFPGFVPGEYVQIKISDDGCGMNSNILSNLFEPFFTTKDVGKGTGLGLATVYGIVKQNSGYISVVSQPEQGAAFTIHLPGFTGKTARVSETVSREPGSFGSETVLLVEDEPAILKITKMMLEKNGFTVLGAGTPGEAISLAREHSGEIDILITDVVMPEMNGRDLAKNLLSLYPGLKRLFMSGYTADVIAHHGVLEDGMYFIQKPFTSRELAEKIQQIQKV